MGVLYLSGCASVAIPGDTACQSDFLECVDEPQRVELPTYRKLRSATRRKHASGCCLQFW